MAFGCVFGMIGTSFISGTQTRRYGANRATGGAAALAPDREVTEVQAVGGPRFRRKLRGRPIVTTTSGVIEPPGVVEDVPKVFARRRQEYATTIRTGKASTFDSIYSCPLIFAVLDQLLDLV